MKGILTMRGAFCLIVLIQISNSIILGITNYIGTDTWLVLLVSIAFALPLMLMYARLIHLMPGKDLFEMMELIFGKAAMVVTGLLFAFYFLSIASIVRGYYAEFVHVTSLLKTSFLIILLAFFLVCSYMAKSGIQSLGKWCVLTLFFTAAVISVMLVLSIPSIDMQNLLPLRETKLSEVLSAGFKGVILPLGEMVFLLGFAGRLDKKINPYKLFIFSMLFSTLFLEVILFQNLSVLGDAFMNTVFFPLYTATSVIHIGTIGTRVESLVMLTFLLVGISKVGIGLFAGTTALTRVFRLKSNNPIIIPVSFFTVALSAVAFPSMTAMFDFIEVYHIFASLFQLVIPAVLWIGAEIRFKSKKITVTKSWISAENA